MERDGATVTACGHQDQDHACKYFLYSSISKLFNDAHTVYFKIDDSSYCQHVSEILTSNFGSNSKSHS